MPKYDAFGREIGENTLSGLGGDTAARPAPTAEDRPEPAQRTLTVVPAGVPGARRQSRRGLGCLIAVVVLAAVLAAPIIALVSFVGTAGDVLDDVTGELDGRTGEPGATEEARPAAPPAGLAGTSLIARPNLAEALSRLRRENVRDVSVVRLEAQRLDAVAVRRRRQRTIQIRYDGELSATPPVAAGAARATIRLSALDPSAPQRLVRGSAARFGVRPNGIDYLIASASPLGAGHRWIAYFKNGTYVEGDARGRVVRRIG